MTPKKAGLALATVVSLYTHAAQAESSLARLTLDGPPVFKFNGERPPEVASPGRWLAENVFEATAGAYVQNSDGLYQGDSGELKSTDLPMSARMGEPFGLGQLHMSELPSAGTVISDAQFDLNKMGVSVALQSPSANAFGNASANWSRYFQLSPLSSVTLAGNVKLQDVGAPPAPLSIDYQTMAPTAPDYNASASLGLSTRDSGVYLGSLLLDCNPTAPSTCNTGVQHFLADDKAFSYSATPDGKVSLTITNRLDEYVYGSFNATMTTGATNIPAVPEFPTYGLVLAGLALIAATSKKRAR